MAENTKDTKDTKTTKAKTTKAKAEAKPVEKVTKPSRANKTVKDIADIKTAVAEAAPQAAAPAAAVAASASVAATTENKVREPKIDKLGRSYATGRRKDAVARVWIKKGSGKVLVNGKELGAYFSRKTHQLIMNQPFLVVNAVGHYDVMCTVKGGGLSGQAGAVRHGISRALQNFDPELRPPLKKAGMLTRDDRIVERKKVGKHKARRSKQWAKR
ncbi:MAG: 30S ribosomal protein S9 [Alphaproteobacteria bacterium]